MVLIKLKPYKKLAVMCAMALLVVAIAAFATGATPNDVNHSEAEDAAGTTTTTSTKQPEEQEAGDAVEPDETDEDEADSYIQYYTEQDAIDIAKVLYHECRGVPSKTEQACVAWTVLNRVDNRDSTIYSIVRAPYQFAFYESAPVRDDLLDLAYDVLDRWNREKNGETDVGRVLPKEYTFFSGRDGRNYFRDGYKGSYNIWDYSLQTPYQDK